MVSHATLRNLSKHRPWNLDNLYYRVGGCMGSFPLKSKQITGNNLDFTMRTSDKQSTIWSAPNQTVILKRRICAQIENVSALRDPPWSYPERTKKFRITLPHRKREFLSFPPIPPFLSFPPVVSGDLSPKILLLPDVSRLLELGARLTMSGMTPR